MWPLYFFLLSQFLRVSYTIYKYVLGIHIFLLYFDFILYIMHLCSLPHGSE